MTSIDELSSRTQQDDLLEHIISSYNPRLASSVLSNLSEYLKYKLNFNLSNDTIEPFIFDLFKPFSSVHVFYVTLYKHCRYRRKVNSPQKKYPNITQELEAKHLLIFFLSNKEVALVLHHIEAIHGGKPYLYLINTDSEEQIEKELFVKKLLASQYNLLRIEFETRTVELQGDASSSVLLACALRGLSQSDFLDIENIHSMMNTLQAQDLETTKAEILKLLRSRIQLEDEELDNILEYSIQKFKKIQTHLRISTDPQFNSSGFDSFGSSCVTRTEGTESSGNSLSVYEMELPSNSSTMKSAITSRRSSARTYRCMITPRKCRPRLSKARIQKTKSMDSKRKWVRKESFSSFESVENEIQPEFSFGTKPDFVQSTKEYYQDTKEMIEKTSEDPFSINPTDRTDTEITEFITSPKAHPDLSHEPKHLFTSTLQPILSLTYYPILKPKIKLDKLFKADLLESPPPKRHKRSDTRHTYKNSIFSDLSYSSIDGGQEMGRVLTVESEDKSQTLEYSDSNPGTPPSPISAIRSLNAKPEGRSSMMRKNSDENDWEERRYVDPLLKTRLRIDLNHDREEEVDQEGSVESVEDPIHITKISFMYEEDDFQKSTQYLHSKIEKLKEKIKNLRQSEISEEMSLSTERNRDFDINAQNVQDVMEIYHGHLPGRASVDICDESKTATMEAQQGELIPSVYKDLISSRNFIHDPIINIENIESEFQSKEGLSEGSIGSKIKFDEAKSCQCNTCCLI